jgi:transcriptional regulator with XRE-family HTH domain
MNIGERIKEVRKMKGKTLRQAAQAAGVDTKMYQHYEAGRARTPVTVLIDLAEFYGYYSLDILLGRATQLDYCEGMLNKYLKSSPEKRKIIDYILSLKS